MYIRQALNILLKRYPIGGCLYLLLNMVATVMIPYRIADGNPWVLVVSAAVWLLWAVLMTSVLGEGLVAWFCNAKAIPAVTKSGAVNNRRLRLYNLMQNVHQASDGDSATENAYLLRLIGHTSTASVTPIGRHTIVISEKMFYIQPIHLETLLAYAASELRKGRPLVYLWLFSANAPITLCLLVMELIRKAVSLSETMFMNLSPRVTGKGFRIADRILSVPLYIWCWLGSVFFAVGMRRWQTHTENEWGKATEDSQRVLQKYPTDNPFLRSIRLMQLPTDRFGGGKRP